MAKDAALKAQAGLIGGIVVIYLANNVSVLIWNYPFLYCWGQSPASRLYLDWGLPTLYLAAAYIIWRLLRRQLTHAFVGFLVVILIMELPRLFDMMFRLGGSCHG
ncbi:hypothetical protein [Rhizobium leguminosarum]|uniref:hypothetical protein n=1 Tax=Rhizobium leguminosarum TaxID=384 RepID=UPI003517DA58